MYIAQVYKVLHDWWRYVIGFILVVTGVIVFSMPHIVAVFMKGDTDYSRLEDMNYLLTLFEPNLNFLFLLLPFAGGLIALFFVVRTLHQQSITSLTTARSKIDWKRIWFAFFFWGIISTGLALVDILGNPDNYQWNFNLQNFLILAVIAIILVPIQTSCEEYIFRGYLMQGVGAATENLRFPFVLIFSIVSILLFVWLNASYQFGSSFPLLYFVGMAVILLLLVNVSLFDGLTISNSKSSLFGILNRVSTPLILTSLVFGLLHLSNPEVDKLGPVIMVYYIGTGLFLGIITLMDDGLELAIGFHAANNLFTALLVTADWTAFQTHSIYKDMSDPSKMGFMEVIVPVFIIFPILIFIFAKKYKWNNWSERLFGKVVKPLEENYKILE